MSDTPSNNYLQTLGTNTSEEVFNIKDIPLAHFNNKQTIKQYELVGSKREVKIESLYKYILLNASNSDTAKADFNKYGKQGFKLKEVSPIFCDNILLYCVIPIQYTKRTNEDGGGRLTIDTDKFNLNTLRRPILTFLNKNKFYNIQPHEIKPVRISKMDGAKTRPTQPTTDRLQDIYKTYREDVPIHEMETVAQYFKIELSKLTYQEVLTLFSKDNLSDLVRDFIYIGDVDFTKDYTGCFNKDLLIQELLSIGFGLQDSDDYGEKTIVNNDHQVGKNCLTFMFGNIRFKVYNKFIHSLEVKSNATQVGTNIYNWVNNGDYRLKQNIPQTLEHGFLRLECTFYRSNNTLPTEEEITNTLNELYEYLTDDVIFNTPIKQQWQVYTECITNNVVIVDLTNQSAVLCYSINSLTKRVSGLILNHPDFRKKKQKQNKQEQDNNEEEHVEEEEISKTQLDREDVYYLLTYCTMDVPILLIFMDLEQTTTKERNINLSYKYVTTKPKEGDKTTNIFTPSNLYYSIDKALESKASTNNQPAQMGLIETDNIKLTIPLHNDKRTYRTKKYIYPFYCIWHDTHKINFISYKELEQIQQEEEFRNNKQEDLLKIESYNNEQLNNLLQCKRAIDDYNEQCNKIEQYFKNRKEQLINLPDNYELVIIAIKPNANGLILLDINNTPYYSIQRVNNYVDTFLKELTPNKWNTYILDDITPIIRFKKEANITTNGKTYVRIGSITPAPRLKTLNREVKEIKGKKEEHDKLKLKNAELCTIVKEKECITLQDLEEGKELLITAIKLREIGKKKIHI